jgi:hypothetical protein
MRALFARTDLIEISFDAKALGATELRMLGKLVNLETLILQESDHSSLVMEAAARMPKLRKLYLTNVPVTDEQVLKLKDLTRLTKLHLVKSKVTAAGIKKLKAALPSLKSATLFDPDAMNP